MWIFPKPNSAYARMLSHGIEVHKTVSKNSCLIEEAKMTAEDCLGTFSPVDHAQLLMFKEKNHAHLKV